MEGGGGCCAHKRNPDDKRNLDDKRNPKIDDKRNPCLKLRIFTFFGTNFIKQNF